MQMVLGFFSAAVKNLLGKLAQGRKGPWGSRSLMDSAHQCQDIKAAERGADHSTPQSGAEGAVLVVARLAFPEFLL